MPNGRKTAFGGKPEIYEDYRKLLERPDIDVVTNGTPDHWHTAINIAALKAKKDVYGEKPLTLTIDEGKLLCKTVEETGRIFQVGTIQRSEKNFQTAVELVRNGRIGKLKQIWVALPYYSTKGGPFAKEQVPEALNWDLYQGQAPVHDYCLQRTHASFRWWYEYAGGIITDWGNHHIDIAHWGMDCDLSGPMSVEARGLFPNPEGPEYYNTPDRFFSRMLYPNGVEVLYFSSINQRAILRRRAAARGNHARAARLALRQGRAGRDQEVQSRRHHVHRRGRPGVRQSRRRSRQAGRGFEEQSPARKCVAGVSQHRPHGELLRVRQNPQAALHAGASRTSHGHGLPSDEHFAALEAEDSSGIP